MRMNHKPRGIEEATEKEILRRQMELLAEASSKGIFDDGISNYSNEMIKIYRELEKPSIRICLCIMLLDLIINLFILIQKLRRG